jgi:DNA-binding NtrC family response regulator
MASREDPKKSPIVRVVGGRTLDAALSFEGGACAALPVPGLLIVFSAGAPALGAIAVPPAGVVLGREGTPPLADDCASRRHAAVACDAGRWTVTDLESRNGTIVDGEWIRGRAPVVAPRTLRIGETVFLFCADIQPFVGESVREDEAAVVGPTLRRAWEPLELAARAGDTLHIRGETGSGKEIAARMFHECGPRAQGPLVAVNCATIPEGVAERLLFGARKGAFSGADADAEGYIQAADGGTLFLDELGELDLPLQAKLLRVVETKEVIAVGATKPRRVDLRICSATHRDLGDLVAEKRFREDLYFRLGRPCVVLPPLRERPEEIAYLIVRELARAGEQRAAASLVEACLLRPWPGNVRELLTEVRAAARAAQAAKSEDVRSRHLGPEAGRARVASAAAASPTPATTPATTSGSSTEDGPMPSRAEIEKALRTANGRVASAARMLGIARIRLRRWLERNEVDPASLAGDEHESKS